jgi:tRNA (guanine-N(7)-)-methyltransferase subunit TRM82
VTDDKFVRVFSVNDGQLEELSQRCMPKRPCALQILPDNGTILCGDKFGDVYSLPLLHSTPHVPEDVDAVRGVTEKDTPEAAKPSFKPSATNLTVHTKRNRRALENQMLQKNFSAKKEPLAFEHKLLLGHVSMLTDIRFATTKRYGTPREYIITADRDEHIRISRGPPQAHIIEGYCLGHTEYISKICLVPGTDLLVSGGGDEWLGIWDWQDFTLKCKVQIQVDDCIDVAKSLLVSLNKQASEDAKQPVARAHSSVNVSGLWTAPYWNAEGDFEEVIVVAIERLPALFLLPVKQLQQQLGSDIRPTVLDLEAPPIDIMRFSGAMIVSLDVRDGQESRLQVWELSAKNGDDRGLHLHAARKNLLEAKLEVLNQTSTTHHDIDTKALDELLYGFANMRKRRGWDEVSHAAQEDDVLQPLGED